MNEQSTLPAFANRRETLLAVMLIKTQTLFEPPSLLQRLHDTVDLDKSCEEFTARQALGRFGRPTELAALAVYLGSDESAFTTGQIHVIDGGWVN